MKENEREIILESFKNEQFQVSNKIIEDLEKENYKIFKANNWIGSCEETGFCALKLNKNKNIKIFFSAQDSCLITISSFNLICSYIEGKNIKEAESLVENFLLMLKGKKFSLEKFSKLEVFKNLYYNENRVNCASFFAEELIKEIKKLNK